MDGVVEISAAGRTNKCSHPIDRAHSLKMSGRPVGSTNGRLPKGGYPNVSEETAGFLSGYVEGEGSFGICKNTRGYGYGPFMSLAARADDGRLAQHLRDATNAGTITRQKSRETSRAKVLWRVAAKMDCVRLLELIDSHPFHGRKAEAYIHLRADDLGLLRWLADLTALGRVYGPYPRSRTTPHPSVRWTLVSGEDNLRLVDLLEQWQPRGRKLLELLAWREAVLERSRGQRWSRNRLKLVHDRLQALRRWAGDLT